MKKATEQFVNLEKKGIAFINFPKLFSNFEVFYPNVDIFNDDQRKKITKQQFDPETVKKWICPHWERKPVKNVD